jgi:hypothetical protein
MVQFAGINKGYNSVAATSSAVNLLNNGAFTAYDIALVPVEDTSLNRRDFEVADYSVTPAIPTVLSAVADENTRLFDVIDSRLYRESRILSFIAPLTSGSENKVGYWDIYGPAAVDVMPTDSTGSIMTSRDGGNVLKISLAAAGVVYLEQPLSELEPLFGRTVTASFSGRKISSSMKVTVSVIANGSELIAIQSNSQLFGAYRRLVGEVDLPERVTGAVLRIKLEGVGGSSIGLSGCSLVLGAQTSVPYTPSLPDLAIPSGVVFMFVGATCPAGFAQSAEMTDRLALISGSSAPLVNYVPFSGMGTDGPDVTIFAGSDTHDHSKNTTAAIDALGPASTARHQTDDTISTDTKVFVHGVQFDDALIATTHFTNEKPVKILGIDHTHLLQSDMEAVPPSFGVRFCRKI